MVKKEVELTLFANYIINIYVCVCIHILIPKLSTKKLLELIKQFRKVAGHKINTQKSIVFLYTSNEQFKIKLRKQFYL